MRITVVGSTGRTGRLVLAEGLRRGHQLTAFTRRPETLPGSSGLTDVVSGDGRDPQAVRRAITSADAVIAIVSARSRKGPHHAAAVSRVLTEAMTDLGVRRLVVTSAYPIVADKPRLPIALLRLLFADAYADVSTMEQIVSASDLDWTIVRLNRLTDRPARGGVRVSGGLFDKPSAMSRSDVAATLLDVVDDDTTVKAAINTAGPDSGR
jgi:putative NADH-flavin reductase